jgi:hypothetical protein
MHAQTQFYQMEHHAMVQEKHVNQVYVHVFQKHVQIILVNVVHYQMDAAEQ